jgi:CYTH domain-containing protein
MNNSGAKSLTNDEVEIELTYLAREIPKEIRGVVPAKMFDAYVPEGSVFPVLRVRQRGGKYEITKKTPLKPGDLSVHIEKTIVLDRAEFQALRTASKRTIEKERYSVAIGGYAAEVDVFTGDLAGLVLIDFEFPDEAAKWSFKPPRCCLAEVTQQRFTLSGQLAGKTYGQIAKKLEAFAYKPLGV